MKGLIITCLFGFSFFVLVNAQDAVEIEKDAIKNVIQTAYVDGLQNNGEMEAIEEGFHPGFNLLGLRDNTLSKFPIYTWLNYWERGKKENPDAPEVLTECKYKMIDITGSAAVAKIELHKEGKLIYTDYLSLYKFAEGWRIVNKIFFKHE